jgi:anaerobic magnesium-protoporphyrin IX monomethyl ester cyclase
MKNLSIALVKVSDMECNPPLGLFSLHAACKRNYQVKVFDFSFQDEYKAFWDSDFDVVGITCLTLWRDDVIELARRIKDEKDSLVVVGGPHATLAPEDLLSSGFIDFLVLGEGEEILPSLLSSINKNMDTFHGIAYTRNGQITKKEPRIVKNLDILPFPSYTEISFEKYKKKYIDEYHEFFLKNRLKFDYDIEIPYESSRGCPYDCIFCSTNRINGKRYRTKNLQKMEYEINKLSSIFGNQLILLRFVDNEMLIHDAHIDHVCSIMRNVNEKRQKKMGWFGQCRVSSLTGNELLLRKMKRSHVVKLLMGGETGYQSGLNRVGKHTTLEEIRESVKLVHQYDIYTVLTFVICFPWETAEDISETVEFALEMREIGADTYVYPLIPFPGTPVYEELRARNLLKKFASSRMLNFITPRMFYNHPYIQETELIDIIEKYKTACTLIDKKLYGGIA